MVFDLIESLGINIVISFYVNGILSNFRVKEGKPVFSSGGERRPMGMFFGENDGWIASSTELTYYKKFQQDDFYVFRPIVSHYVGFIDSHELVVVGGVPVVNATLFNKLATLDTDPETDFRILYEPPYCSNGYEPTDTNHVNGIGLRNGRLRYITSFSDKEISETKGWKDFRETGVVWDIVENKPVLTDLFAPHSPKYVDDTLYVCNSGKGELIRYRDGVSDVLRLGSFTRGLAVYGNYLIVGSSAIREDAKHIDREILSNNKCGLFVVNRETFELEGEVDFGEYGIKEEIELKEVFDIAIMPENTLVASSASEGYMQTHFF